MTAEELIQHLPQLAIKHMNGELNDEESTMLQAWLQESPGNQLYFHKLTNPDKIREELETIYSYKEMEESSFQKLDKSLVFNTQRTVIPIRSSRWYTYAAVFLLVVASGVFYYIFRATRQKTQTTIARHDVPAPTGYHARLQLADGRSVSLDDSNTVAAIVQGATIVQIQNGKITYHPSPAYAQQPMLYNTVATERGGTYALQLPDGSNVWLNAESSIRYPVAFTGNERRVNITGEVYFEVQKNKQQPFRVEVPAVHEAPNQPSEVEVLGTHFNINAYKDEDTVRTTLFEGSVKLNNTRIVPGQQAQLLANKAILVKQVDTESIMAWKNGKFIFNGEQDIRYSMRQVARWYNVTVLYKPNLPPIHVRGNMIRQESLSSLLTILRATHVVDFDLEGNILTVKPWIDTPDAGK